MKKWMNRQEIIELVTKIKDFDGSEEELDELILELENGVIYPEITNLIYWDEKTPEEIADIALAYKPIVLGFDENIGK